MFAHISLSGLKKSAQFSYAQEVPFFKGRRRLDFKPGLNVLVGPNGCGKSTVLKILAESMCALQGGVSAVTETAVHQGIDMGRGSTGMRDKLGLKVAHDGQPVMFCDPRQTVGLLAGAFDDDFFDQGVAETLARGSHGQTALRRMGGALAIVHGKAVFPASVRRTMSASNVNSMWQEALALLDKRLVPTVPRGQASLLLDEPEANYSVQWQARLWEMLAQPVVAKRFQIIVASHSVFAMGIPHANYIDFVPGFRQDVENILRSRFAAPHAS